MNRQLILEAFRQENSYILILILIADADADYHYHSYYLMFALTQVMIKNFGICST